MTIVQNDTIPLGITGNERNKLDMFVRGKTGSGKTLTFGAISLTNMLNNLNHSGNSGNVKIVILTNTTSLCGQICEVYEELVKYVEPKINICK
jgi:superfamily II DNA/RNA helicase